MKANDFIPSFSIKDDRLPITRRVLIEKVQNNKLIIYTQSSHNKRVKNPINGVLLQYEQGRRLAIKLGLIPVLYSDTISKAEQDNPLSKSQCLLIKEILDYQIKYIYISNIKMLSRYKWMRKYILYLYAIKKVVLYTKSGIYPLQQLQSDEDIKIGVDILIEEMNEFPLPTL